jgi:hypothetical protein
VQENEMTAATFARAGSYDAASGSKGFMRRLLDRYIEVQMRKARRHVNAYLQNLDDNSLRNLGYCDADIKLIRQSDTDVSLMA